MTRKASGIVRITVQSDARDAVTLKVEGMVSGANVTELQRAWRDLGPSLESRRLVLDLRGVTYLDVSGTQVLGEIYSKTGAEFLVESPLTKYFMEQVQQDVRNHLK